MFTDDICQKLAYDGFRPAAIVEVEPGLRERTMTTACNILWTIQELSTSSFIA